MMPRSGLVVGCVFGAVVLLTPTLAFAQAGTAERPYRGLFGGAGGSGGKQALNLTISLAGAYDDNVLAETVGLIDSARVAQGGTYSSLALDLDYARRGRIFQLGGAAGASGRYYSGDRAATSVGYYATGAVSAALGRRTQVSLSQVFSYEPSYLARLFPVLSAPMIDEGGVRPLDYGQDTEQAFTSLVTSANVSRGIGRRGSLSFGASFRYSTFNAANTLKAYDVRGQFTQGLTRNTALRMGYGYRNGTTGFSTAETALHDIDIGVDYSRAFSFSRRTTFGLNVGSSVVRSPFEDQIAGTEALQYRLVGDAWLNHQIGRSWVARAEFSRDVSFIDVLPTPVFSDAIRGSLGGLLNRRTDISTTIAYTKGESAGGNLASQFDAFTGTLRLQFALSRSWATYTEYSYYAYDFSRNAQLVGEVPTQFQRQTVRAGLTVWVPLSGR